MHDDDQGDDDDDDDENDDEDNLRRTRGRGGEWDKNEANIIGTCPVWEVRPN